MRPSERERLREVLNATAARLDAENVTEDYVFEMYARALRYAGELVMCRNLQDPTLAPGNVAPFVIARHRAADDAGRRAGGTTAAEAIYERRRQEADVDAEITRRGLGPAFGLQPSRGRR